MCYLRLAALITKALHEYSAKLRIPFSQQDMARL